MGKLTGQSALYQGMNVVGAAGFVVNGWWHGAVPSASLNIVWALIGGFALWRIRRRRGAASDRAQQPSQLPPLPWRGEDTEP
jgi:hypothetical protein